MNQKSKNIEQAYKKIDENAKSITSDYDFNDVASEPIGLGFEERGVGDLHSDKKGTAARFNGGKPRVDLLPLYMVVQTIDSSNFNQHQNHALETLHEVARFQGSGDESYIDNAMKILSPYWTDCAEAFGYGAKKYASWNWSKGMMWSVPIGCIGRHALAMFRGEMLDSESGLSHLGHIMCNVVMLKLYFSNYKEGNDLPPKNFGIPDITQDDNGVYKLERGSFTYYFHSRGDMLHAVEDAKNDHLKCMTYANFVTSNGELIKSRYNINDIIEVYIKASRCTDNLIA